VCPEYAAFQEHCGVKGKKNRAGILWNGWMHWVVSLLALLELRGRAWFLESLAYIRVQMCVGEWQSIKGTLVDVHKGWMYILARGGLSHVQKCV
jgi:hypothetical protein